MTGEVCRRQRSRDRTASLAGLDATEEELLDPDENVGDNLLEIRIVRRHVASAAFNRLFVGSR